MHAIVGGRTHHTFMLQQDCQELSGELFIRANENPGRVGEEQMNPLHVAIVPRFLFYFCIYFPSRNGVDPAAPSN